MIPHRPRLHPAHLLLTAFRHLDSLIYHPSCILLTACAHKVTVTCCGCQQHAVDAGLAPAEGFYPVRRPNGAREMLEVRYTSNDDAARWVSRRRLQSSDASHVAGSWHPGLVSA